MDTYLVLKLVHVLSAALLIGAGAGSTFFLWYTHRRGDTNAISIAISAALLIECWIIVPTVVLQPVTGFWMLDLDGQAVRQPWVIAALALFSSAGIVWVPALVLKFRLRNMARAAVAHGQPLPALFHRWMRWWLALWWTVFVLTLGVLTLMVFRASL